MAMLANLPLGYVWSSFQSRERLKAEIVVLRHQLNILRRKAPRWPRLSGADRALFAWMRHLFPSIASAITIIRPETVIGWHRAGFRAWWRWKSRNLGGRPQVDRELRDLIRRVCEENRLWGAPRIHGELLKLGFTVAQSTVSKYMLRGRKSPSQSWKTFLRNHADSIAAADFLFVPTLTFERLFAFVVLGLGRRTILWIGVTTNPMATPVTREKALEKLHAFTPHIGYPDKWRDYSGLRIERGDLIGNVERSDIFEWRFTLDRINDPVDRNEWDMRPPTVNADYRPDLNSIFFPAAILQPPVFDANVDDAVNYGAIGAVIGHEISHGFDDQGSKFDAVGNLKSWWTDEDRKAFDARTDALSAQYDSYEPLLGMHVNGKLTLGENIADLAGLMIAINAYHISPGGKPAPVMTV